MSKLLECDGRRKWSLWITWPAYRGAHEKKHTKTKQKKMHCRRCLVDMRRCSEVGNRHVLPEMCLLYTVYAHYCNGARHIRVYHANARTASSDTNIVFRLKVPRSLLRN